MAERPQWVLPAVEILTLAINKEIELYCSIISLPTVSYIMERQVIILHGIVLNKIEYFIGICEPLYADKQIAKSALKSPF